VHFTLESLLSRLPLFSCSVACKLLNDESRYPPQGYPPQQYPPQPYPPQQYPPQQPYYGAPPAGQCVPSCVHPSVASSSHVEQVPAAATTTAAAISASRAATRARCPTATRWRFRPRWRHPRSCFVPVRRASPFFPTCSCTRTYVDATLRGKIKQS
jgi:hypothetical protein